MPSKLFQYVKDFEAKRKNKYIKYRAGETEEPALSKLATMGGITPREQDISYGLIGKDESDPAGFRAESRAKMMRTPELSKERGGRRNQYWEK
jgi:hypothetical protein